MSLINSEKIEISMNPATLVIKASNNIIILFSPVLLVAFVSRQASATRVMLHIHNNGVGIAGIYTREIAETRVAQVHQMASEAGHPLQCTMEPE